MEETKTNAYSITELRQRNGFSHDELAKRLNVDASEVRSWENGTVAPDTAQQKLLAELFQVTPNEIAIGTGATSTS